MAWKVEDILDLKFGTLYSTWYQKLGTIILRGQLSVALLKNCPGELCLNYMHHVGYVS